MSGYVIEIAPGAVDDIADAFRWYQERNALIADAFRADVFGTIDRLAEHPLGKAADEDGNRKRLLRRFPYSVVYEVAGHTVTILAVAHHRREPDYWHAAKVTAGRPGS